MHDALICGLEHLIDRIVAVSVNVSAAAERLETLRSRLEIELRQSKLRLDGQVALQAKSSIERWNRPRRTSGKGSSLAASSQLWAAGALAFAV